MDQIASFLDSPGRLPAAAPEPNLVTLVSRRDDSPEAAGIFRVSSEQDRPTDRSTAGDATEASPTPLPAKPARTRSASVAISTDGRASRP